MTREELYKAAKSKLHEDFCLNGKCTYYGECERGEGHVPAHKFSCNHDFALSMIIKGIELAINSQKSPWISVKDDLPCNHEELLDPSCEYNETVIVLTTCGNDYYNNWMELGRNGEWVWHNIQNITHWMKLPELPKE